MLGSGTNRKCAPAAGGASKAMYVREDLPGGNKKVSRRAWLWEENKQAWQVIKKTKTSAKKQVGSGSKATGDLQEKAALRKSPQAEVKTRLNRIKGRREKKRRKS
jgi:hypothetical protein